MKKRILATFVLFIVAVVSLELTGLLYHYIMGNGLHYSRINHSNDGDEATPKTKLPIAWRLHPYFGYIDTPGVSLSQTQWGNLDRMRSHGYAEIPEWVSRFKRNSNGFDTENGVEYPILKESKNDFFVGIFGGSVADSFHLNANIKLREELAKIPALKNRKIKILDFASSGYKQPQQLIVLNYFLAIGQQLDLVVNIDGVNDLALVGYGWQHHRFLPSMPSFGIVNAVGLFNSGTLTIEKVSTLKELLETRRSLDRNEHQSQSAKSAFLSALGDAWSKRLKRKMVALETELMALNQNQSQDPLYVINLRNRNTSDDGLSVLLDAANLWARSSSQMDGMLKVRGIPYVHVLQPNQYNESLRVFSDRERKIAFGEFEMKQFLIAGYPLLRKKGVELEKDGEAYLDGSNIFDREKAQVYEDACCHLTLVANQILAKAIAGKVKTILEKNKFASLSGGAN